MTEAGHLWDARLTGQLRSCPSHVWARVVPQTCRTRVAAPHPLRHPTSAPEFALFLSDTASLPRTPACWGRELGTQGGHWTPTLQVPPVSLLHRPDDVSQEEQLDVSHSGTSAFSPSVSGTGADAAGLPRQPAGLQHRVQQLGIRCAPPKTAHPGARHI